MRRLLLAGLVLLIATVGYCADKPALTVSWGIPERSIKKDVNSGIRYMRFIEQDKVFYIKIKNNTDKPIRLWDRFCPLGYFNVYFEYVDKEGKVVRINRLPPAKFGIKAPVFVIIPPGDVYIHHFGNEDMETFNMGSYSFILKMRVVYEVPQTVESQSYNVWSGKITSEYEDITVKSSW